MIHDITIIIPTHERDKILERSISYWGETGLPVIIADSSLNATKNIMPHNIQYIHYPGVSYFEKLLRVTNLIKTKYSVLCADDDFLILSGIEKCVQFLEDNAEYHCATGRTMIFKPSTPINSQHAWVYPRAKSIEQNHAIDRFKYHFSNYNLPTFYAVTRSDTIKYIWKKTFERDDHQESRFGELLPTLITVLNGKVKLLNCIYSIREYNINSGGHTLPTIKDYFHNGAFDSHYAKFKNILIHEIIKYSSHDEKIANRLVKNGLENYLGSTVNILKFRALLKRVGQLFGFYQLYLYFKKYYALQNVETEAIKWEYNTTFIRS